MKGFDLMYGYEMISDYLFILPKVKSSLVYLFQTEMNSYPFFILQFWNWI